MGTEAVSSALRLELRPGEWVLWDARPHRFESLENDRARIRDGANDELREVSVAEIRSLSCLPAAELDASLERQRTVDLDDRSLAKDGRWQSGRFSPATARRVRVAAVALGTTSRAVYRLAARYRISAQTTSLLPQRRGPNQKRRRLGDARERLIAEAIERRYLVRPRTPMEEVYRYVKQRCRDLSIPAPARGSVLAQVRAVDARHAARRRLGSKEAQAIARSTPGELEASSVLELIQMDHTLADIIIVDSVHRRPIGRPWLTLAIDVATRCVLGAHAALEAPSALAVALCMEDAYPPKNRSGLLMKSDVPWPVYGFVQSVFSLASPQVGRAVGRVDRRC